MNNYKKISLCLLGVGSLLFSCEEKNKMNYPQTKKDLVSDEYFGHKVDDPYRWLENDKSEETAKWVLEENKVTFDYLNTIPFKKGIAERLTELWNYEKVSAPTKHGDWLYFYKNDGLQNQYVLYRKKKGSDVEEVFLDPNTFSEDGTTSLSTVRFSNDARLVAYSTSKGGSDWRTIHIMDVTSKTEIEEPILDAKFTGISWKGTEGFYYSSYDKPKEGSALSGMTQHHKLMYHQLGTKQSDDLLVFGGGETPRRYIDGSVTEDEKFLIITAAEATSGNELYIQDLNSKNAPIVPVVSDFKNNHSVVFSKNGTLYIDTNLNAPNNRLVKVQANNPSPDNWIDVIPETNNVLSVAPAGGTFYANYIIDAVSKVYQFNLEGEKLREIKLPGFGSANGFYAKEEEDKVFYSFTSYIYPSTTFELDINSGNSTEYLKSKVKFDPSQFVSEQVFYTSKDGTKVPMMITYKKGLKKDGTNPTILYGYGGFNISLKPSFSTANIVWLENGGIYAVPNLRGGGEYGEKWHVAGTKMQKQNVFDDFITAAEYLKINKYTSTEKLALRGGSNGGLLVGAVMTQRPDLMKVAFPAVGVLDMLRYNKFTAGAGWSFDYGTAEDSEEMFNYLKGYSPYHNVKNDVNYPATMITTADHDDRVVPAHSFKFAAELQDKDAGENPILIRIETNAGHGAGKPTDMIIDGYADMFAFAWYNMGETPALEHKIDENKL